MVWTADSTTVTADSLIYTADGGVTSSNISTTSIGQLLALADLYHWFGQDLNADNTGDAQVVTGTLRGEQRVLRRLLTNPGDYIFHPEYGGGLPAFIGQPVSIGKITGVVRSQLALEAVVSKSPPAVVNVSQSSSDFTAFTVSISYTDAFTQTPVALTFTVEK